LSELAKEYYVEIQIEHLELKDHDLFETFNKHPSDIIKNIFFGFNSNENKYIFKA
ncbi:23338_t:CDS:1, partial [Entrophospora sp. SA101]